MKIQAIFNGVALTWYPDPSLTLLACDSLYLFLF